MEKVFKTSLAVTLAAMLVLSPAAFSSKPQEQKPEVQTVEAPVVAKVAPVVKEEKVVVQKSEPVVQEEQVVVAEPEVTQEDQISYDDAWAVVLTKVNAQRVNGAMHSREVAIAGVIMEQYESNPELFTKDTIGSTINSCIRFYEAQPDNFTAQKHLTAKNCGF